MNCRKVPSGSVPLFPPPQRQEVVSSGAVLIDQPVLQVSSSSCGSVHKDVTQTPKPRRRWRQSASPRRHINPAPGLQPQPLRLPAAQGLGSSRVGGGQVVEHRSPLYPQGILFTSQTYLGQKAAWDSSSWSFMPGCNSIGQAMLYEPGGYSRLDHTLHPAQHLQIQRCGLFLGSFFLLPVPTDEDFKFLSFQRSRNPALPPP